METERDTVIITRAEHESLLKKAEILESLIEYGVESWEFFNHALDTIDSELGR